MREDVQGRGRGGAKRESCAWVLRFSPIEPSVSALWRGSTMGDIGTCTWPLCEQTHTRTREEDGEKREGASWPALKYIRTEFFTINNNLSTIEQPRSDFCHVNLGDLNLLDRINQENVVELRPIPHRRTGAVIRHIKAQVLEAQQHCCLGLLVQLG
ncbi:hypothetical protein K438DRAFT_1775511 [Mycena galopus ATCC 62051]|nr:hypothetical protein K438DRAFT_1775511 [Mycena galopus ATCC 62051]